MNFFEMRWRLCACRVQAGYTQKEIAKLLDVTEQTVLKWENGTTTPKMEVAQKLSELYQIPIAYMDWSKEGNATPLRAREIA